MLPHDLTSFPYLSPEYFSNLTIPPNYSILENNNFPSTNTNFNFKTFSTPNTYNIPFPHDHLNTTQSSSTTTLSNNSTSDEADEQQLRIIDERRQRRMISNRESARRSRMRKQKHLDELFSQVLRLRNENHSLIDKLNHVSDSYDLVVQQNSRLKEEASLLRQMFNELQTSTPPPPPPPLRDDDLDHEEIIPCNTAHLRTESSNQPIITTINSVNLFH